MSTSTSNDVTPVYVWGWLPNTTAPTPVGVLQPHPSGGLAFRYGNKYLLRPDAVALSPTLPLQPRWFTDTAQLGLPGALRDAAPDAWGRRVIAQRNRGTPDGNLDETTYLLQSGSNRFGAIDFQQSPATYTPRNETATLDQLHHATDLIQAGEPLPDSLAAALLHGSTLGGARPKATITDIHGVDYLAKFSTASDPLPVVGSEAAALTLARHAGLDVPDSHLTRSLGRDVLLIRRFDRTPTGGRRMTVSALTLLDLGEMTARYGTYPEIVDAIHHHSPAAIGPDMFRRIAFNIAISNTDDHLRNHAAFWDGHHLQLTPAYDLSPMMRTGDTAYQALAYDRAGTRTSNFVSLIAAAPEYDLTAHQARTVVDEIIDTIHTHWDEAADTGHLTTTDKARLWQHQFLHPAASYDLPTHISLPAHSGAATPQPAPTPETETTACTVCGKPLTSPQSRARGAGPTCARKHQP